MSKKLFLETMPTMQKQFSHGRLEGSVRFDVRRLSAPLYYFPHFYVPITVSHRPSI